MTTRHITRFMSIYTLVMLLCGCDGMATLFHGAKPQAPPVTYTVAFDANGASGQAPAAQTVNAGMSVGLPSQGGMASVGNVFTGWNESAGGGGASYAAGASVTVTRNMVFYAQWIDGLTPQYTVTFNANGATGGAPPAPQTVYRGVSISLPAQGTLSFAGKTFDGWNSAANGAGANYTAGASFTVNAHVTLYAKWRSAVQYTVTYHANGATGGTAPAAQTVDPGTEINLPGPGSLTYTDRTFDGWNTNAGGTGTAYAEGASYTVNANATLYAKWVVTPVVPPGDTLAEKLAYIAGRADDGTVYDIEISENIHLEPQIISTTGRNVIIIIRSANSQDIQTINLDGTGSLFTISNNITLILKDIQLVGRVLNTSSLVAVTQGGTLIIEDGAMITGNTNNAPVSTSDTSNEAGGVFVTGTVIMNGGNISENKSMGSGGGVSINSGGSFTLKGGTISGNETLYQGAGVAVYNGTFIMNGGIISGNKQTAESSSQWVVGGGGVYVGSGSTTFTKTPASGSTTSGIIYGAVATDSLKNIAMGRRYDGGDAILAFGIGKHRNTTLGQYDEISTLYVNVGWE